MRLTALLVFACVSVAAVMSAQQAPPRDMPRVAAEGSASVSGTVVLDDEARTPLRRATVSLVRSGIEDIRSTTTDDEGRYSFPGLTAGSYTLAAGKAAYLGISYGAAKPGMPGTAIALGDGEAFVAKSMTLTRGGVITGRVLDRSGQPVFNAMIEANQVVVMNGVQRRTGFRVAGTLTNAHGEYRLYGLRPGDYLVSSAPPPIPVQAEITSAELSWITRGSGSAPPPARLMTYAPTMFPGTADASAGVVISLSRGEERHGVDFPLQFVPVARVNGVVKGVDGQPVPDVFVICSTKNANPLLPPSGVPTSRTMADGSFTCPGLIPARYELLVRGTAVRVMPDVAERINMGVSPFGIAEVTVSGVDQSNVVIQMQTGGTVSGRIDVGVPAEPKPDLSQFRVILNTSPGAPVIAGRPSVTPTADGTFRFDGVIPASYRVTGTGPAGWSLKSAMLNGRDISDLPIEVASSATAGLTVTFTNVQTDLFGTITDADKRPAPQLYVVLFPTEQAMWLPEARRIRVVRSAENGSYSFPGLPAGDYYLCALTEFDTGFQFEPDYLRPFIGAAIRITIAEGEKKQQNLQIAK